MSGVRMEIERELMALLSLRLAATEALRLLDVSVGTNFDDRVDRTGVSMAASELRRALSKFAQMTERAK